VTPRDVVRVEPILVSSGNCEAVVGQSWRWVRDNAAFLGVPIHRVGGKRFVEAAELLAAVRRCTVVAANDGDAAATPGDDLERPRTAMGERRVTR
jgi:hypothetical protein